MLAVNQSLSVHLLELRGGGSQKLLPIISLLTNLDCEPQQPHQPSLNIQTDGYK